MLTPALLRCLNWIQMGELMPVGAAAATEVWCAASHGTAVQTTINKLGSSSLVRTKVFFLVGADPEISQQWLDSPGGGFKAKKNDLKHTMSLRLPGFWCGRMLRPRVNEHSVGKKYSCVAAAACVVWLALFQWQHFVARSLCIARRLCSPSGLCWEIRRADSE
jgi:hypothetical protein